MGEIGTCNLENLNEGQHANYLHYFWLYDIDVVWAVYLISVAASTTSFVSIWDWKADVWSAIFVIASLLKILN